MDNTNNSLKVSLKYFSLSFLLLASLFCVAFLAFPVFAPASAIEFYKSNGFNAAAVGILERKYAKSNKIEDLYNLVVACNEFDKSERLLKYTNKLLNREDFDGFAEAFDEYALSHTSKDKLYLVASVENYLHEIRIEYEYKQNRDRAFLEAVSCFEFVDIKLFYFEKYVSCILLDSSLSGVKKTQFLSETANATYMGDTILAILSDRYNEFKASSALADLDVLKLEQLFELKSVEVVLLEAVGAAELETEKAELENISDVLEAKLNND